MGKGLRKAIPSTTTSRATRKLGRVFIDLGGKREVTSIGGKHYPMIVRDDLTRFTWLFFLKHKSDAADKFEEFLASVRDHGEVEIVRSDDGGEFTGQAFKRVCTRHRIKQEFTSADSPQFNGTAERTLGLIGTSSLAARIQAPLIFPGADVPTREDLWAKAVAWSVDSLNRSATTANPDRTSPYEMWYGKEPPLKDLPFLTPCFYRKAKLRKKHHPRGVPGFYLGPDHHHPRDSMRVLGPSGNIIVTRHVTWWVPPTPMTGQWCSHGEPETISEDGCEKSSTDASSNHSETDGSSTEGSRVSSQDADHSNDESSSTSSESPDPSHISGVPAQDVASVSGEDASIDSQPSRQESVSEIDDSEEGTSSRSLRTVMRQISDHLHDPPGTDNVRPGRTRQQTRRMQESISQQTSGLLKTRSANLSSTEFKPALAAFTADPVMGEKTGLVDFEKDEKKVPLGKVEEVEPEPLSYADVKCSSHRRTWEDAMARELDGLKATNTFTRSTAPPGRRAISAKWVFKWKSNQYGEVERAKARLVARGYVQTDGVDYFETFSPTPSPSSIRLVVAGAFEY